LAERPGHLPPTTSYFSIVYYTYIPHKKGGGRVCEYMHERTILNVLSQSRTVQKGGSNTQSPQISPWLQLHLHSCFIGKLWVKSPVYAVTLTRPCLEAAGLKGSGSLEELARWTPFNWFDRRTNITKGSLMHSEDFAAVCTLTVPVPSLVK